MQLLSTFPIIRGRQGMVPPTESLSMTSWVNNHTNRRRRRRRRRRRKYWTILLGLSLLVAISLLRIPPSSSAGGDPYHYSSVLLLGYENIFLLQNDSVTFDNDGTNTKNLPSDMAVSANKNNNNSSSSSSNNVTKVVSDPSGKWKMNIISTSESIPTTTSTATAMDHPTRNNNLSVPLNLRLVIVGDSLSRYLYLSLIYYLHHDGKWPSQGHPLLEKVKDSNPQAWNDWLHFTNFQFQTAEECDCYRYWTHPFKWYRHCENRYYHYPHHHHPPPTFHNKNNTRYVTFLTKFGGNPFHGHVMPSQVFAEHRKGINQTLRSYNWVYKTWDQLIEDYISKWNPKPNVFIFNQGHWKGHELREEKVLKRLRRSLRKHGIRGIYRTTTYRQDERQASYEMTVQTYSTAPTRKHDNIVCQYFECWNVSWTANISITEYVDPVHFKASINNQMNQQLIREFLQS